MPNPNPQAVAHLVCFLQVSSYLLPVCRAGLLLQLQLQLLYVCCIHPLKLSNLVPIAVDTHSSKIPAAREALVKEQTRVEARGRVKEQAICLLLTSAQAQQSGPSNC